MWQDPIVEETRNLRKQYAEKFNHNIEAIFADICKRQENSKRKRVSFPARKPVITKKVRNLLNKAVSGDF